MSPQQSRGESPHPEPSPPTTDIPSTLPIPSATAMAATEMNAVDDPYPRLKLSHQRFIDALLMNGGNQTQAYIAAGYVGEHADVNASQLLRNHGGVRTAFEIRKAQISARAAISQEYIAETLVRHATHRIASLYNPDTFELLAPSQWPEEMQDLVEEITYIPAGEKGPGHVKVKMVSKQAALKMLGEYKGMFKERSSGENRALILDLTVNAQTNILVSGGQDNVGGLTIDLQAEDV